VREDERTIAGLRVLAVRPANAAPSLAVVLLHGFRMRPEDLAPFAHSLGVPALYVLPEGPLAADPAGRAWWHIDAAKREEALALGPRDFAVQHPPDLPSARARLEALLAEVRVLAGDAPLVLGGFSQGAMLSVDTVLRATPAALGVRGLVLFSGSRIAWTEGGPLAAPERLGLAGLPVLLTHGREDADLSFASGEALRDALAEAGAETTWVPFDRGHEIPLVAWRALRKLLLRLSTPPGQPPVGA
jgi:phospholipase/carboxylesterase